MKTSTRPLQLQARFRHLIYSPRGEIEGVLVDVDGGPAQVVFDRHDDLTPVLFADLLEGQTLIVEGFPAAPSDKGEPEHSVFGFVRLKSVDGAKPATRKPAQGAAYRGKAIRFNYARHGAANGVVLDSGDFIHTRPEGLAGLKLKIGDVVEADGDAQMLTTGKGWAVEAQTVNGKPVRR